MDGINQTWFTLICLSLAVFRIYLEVIRFDFAKLPLTSKLPARAQTSMHRWGFYFSVLYFMSFAPEILLS